MTELQVFLTFLTNLPFYKGQRFDLERLGKRLQYAINHQRFDTLVSLLDSLLSFDDAIVNGLNNALFALPDDSLSRYPSSVLPKFLFGLTSRVFDHVSGALLPNYCSDSAEALLTGLRLIRRAKVEGYSFVATERAIEEFIEPQTAPEPVYCDVISENMTTFWSVILDDMELKLGFPGNGVTSDMRFPYVPTMSIVNPFTLPAPIRLPMQSAYMEFLPQTYDVTSDCEFIKSYDYVPYEERIVTLSVVPKSFKVGRGITVTNTSAVIVGATLRESIWARIRKLGLSRLVNVHDQTLSHESLVNNPNDTFCRDVKGGSTCIRASLQRRYLSSSRLALNLFNFSVPSAVRVKDKIVDLVTLTMGDASCTALLSVDMLGYLVLAQSYLSFGIRLLSKEEINHSISKLKEEDRVRCVGDDVLGPSRLGQLFDYIVSRQGIVINQRKSSEPGAVHQESCGCWVLRAYDGTTRRIYPFRAPDYSNDLVADLSTAMRSYERTRTSKFSIAVLIAYGSVLSHSLEYLHNESYSPDRIGSPAGPRPNTRSVRLRPRRRFTVSDDVAYAFRCRESQVEPRLTRRPVVDRGRIVKSRDHSFERSAINLVQKEVLSSVNCAPTNWNVRRLNEVFAVSYFLSIANPHLLRWL